MKVVSTERAGQAPCPAARGHVLKGSPSRGSPHPQVQQLERSIGLKDLAMADLEQKVHEMEASTFDGVFVWKISDFARKRQEAVAGRTPAIFSPGAVLELVLKLLLSWVLMSPPGQSVPCCASLGGGGRRRPLITVPHLSTRFGCGAARRGSGAGGLPTPAQPGRWLFLLFVGPLWVLRVWGTVQGCGVEEGACCACVAARAPVRPAASP